MTAITEAPESLDWVTFLDDEPESCDGMHRVPCPRQPLMLIFWQKACDHGYNPQRACREHMLEFIKLSRQSDGVFHCYDCGEPILLVRIEAYR